MGRRGIPLLLVAALGGLTIGAAALALTETPSSTAVLTPAQRALQVDVARTLGAPNFTMVLQTSGSVALTQTIHYQAPDRVETIDSGSAVVGLGTDTTQHAQITVQIGRTEYLQTYVPGQSPSWTSFRLPAREASQGNFAAMFLRDLTGLRFLRQVPRGFALRTTVQVPGAHHSSAALRLAGDVLILHGRVALVRENVSGSATARKDAGASNTTVAFTDFGTTAPIPTPVVPKDDGLPVPAVPASPQS
jgi:hypothetical protein